MRVTPRPRERASFPDRSPLSANACLRHAQTPGARFDCRCGALSWEANSVPAIDPPAEVSTGKLTEHRSCRWRSKAVVSRIGLVSDSLRGSGVQGKNHVRHRLVLVK